MIVRGMDGRAGGTLGSCGWCGRYVLPPDGRLLRAVADGRTVCSGCGRFTVECDCETNYRGRRLVVPLR